MFNILVCGKYCVYIVIEMHIGYLPTSFASGGEGEAIWQNTFWGYTAAIHYYSSSVLIGILPNFSPFVRSSLMLSVKSISKFFVIRSAKGIDWECFT